MNVVRLLTLSQQIGKALNDTIDCHSLLYPVEMPRAPAPADWIPAFQILGKLDWLGGVSGVSYQNRIGVTADQANDRILYFHVDIDAEKPLCLI